LAHDFLWRTAVCLPQRGNIGIFNRSYYEETLIVRVHPEILGGEHIPKELLDGEKIWKQRFQSIQNLEKHLHRNGTRIVKFFLHLSKEEQRKRFLARIDDPHKHWKLSADDIRERDLWSDYMSAYEECLAATSTEDSPWFVVPADDKPNARLIISKIVLDTLKSLKLEFPKVTRERQTELKKIRQLLER
jgi:PPK2 family polyphosphate:nucleotide phosphotransferase